MRPPCDDGAVWPLDRGQKGHTSCLLTGRRGSETITGVQEAAADVRAEATTGPSNGLQASTCTDRLDVESVIRGPYYVPTNLRTDPCSYSTLSVVAFVRSAMFAMLLLGCASSPLYALGPYAPILGATSTSEPTQCEWVVSSIREAGYVPSEIDPIRGIISVPMRSGPAYFRVQLTRANEGVFVLVLMEGPHVRYVGERQRVRLAMQYEYDRFTVRLRELLSIGPEVESLGVEESGSSLGVPSRTVETGR